MRTRKDRPTREQVLQYLRYDAATGSFTRISDGRMLGFWEHRAERVTVHVNGRDFVAAHLAWLIVEGEWPDGRLLHLDGDRRNLAFDNLGKERRVRLHSRSDADAQRRLRELFEFDGERGVFIARVPRPGADVGDVVVGCDFRGYYLLSVDGEQYLLHRLIWLYVHGHWPTENIDHRDGDGRNNRLINLRDVAQAINLQNQREARSNNYSTGLLGAYRRKDTGRYTSRICVDGKDWALGCFDTAEEAHAAYIEAKRRLHEGCTL